jgi:hypothetical protein
VRRTWVKNPGVSETMNEISEGAEWRRYTKAQLAEQLAKAIDDIAGFARQNGFPSVGVMLDMARDLARAERDSVERGMKDDGEQATEFPEESSAS